MLLCCHCSGPEDAGSSVKALHLQRLLDLGLGGRNGRARALVRNAFAILDASVVGIRGGVLVLALALELDGLGI